MDDVRKPTLHNKKTKRPVDDNKNSEGKTYYPQIGFRRFVDKKLVI